MKDVGIDPLKEVKVNNTCANINSAKVFFFLFHLSKHKGTIQTFNQRRAYCQRTYTMIYLHAVKVQVYGSEFGSWSANTETQLPAKCLRTASAAIHLKAQVNFSLVTWPPNCGWSSTRGAWVWVKLCRICSPDHSVYNTSSTCIHYTENVHNYTMD